MCVQSLDNCSVGRSQNLSPSVARSPRSLAETHGSSHRLIICNLRRGDARKWALRSTMGGPVIEEEMKRASNSPTVVSGQPEFGGLTPCAERNVITIWKRPIMLSTSYRSQHGQ